MEIHKQPSSVSNLHSGVATIDVGGSVPHILAYTTQIPPANFFRSNAASLQLPSGVNLNPHDALRTPSIPSTMAHLLVFGTANRANA